MTDQPPPLEPDRDRRAFPPPPEGAWMGFEAGQVALAALAALVGVVGLIANVGNRSLLGAVGSLVVGGGLAALAFGPTRGVLAYQYLLKRLTHAARSASGETRTRRGRETRHRPWTPLRGLSIERDTETGWGVVVDRQARSTSCVIAVETDGLSLVGPTGRAAALDRWQAVLRESEQSGAARVTVGVTVYSLPEDLAAAGAYMTDRYDAARAASYPRLAEGYLAEANAAAASLVTQTLVTVAVRGGKPAERPARLRREAKRISDSLDRSELVVCGAPLSPSRLSWTLQLHLDPWRAAEIAQRRVHGQEGAIERIPVGPVAADEDYGGVRLDDRYLCVLVATRWPTQRVAPGFLEDLVAAGHGVRAATVLYEVMARRSAAVRVDARLNRRRSRSKTKAADGAPASAGERIEEQSAEALEDEIAHGDTLARDAAYIACYGQTLDELEATVDAVSATARSIGVELRTLWGDQARGVTWAMPGVIRGIR